MSTPETLLQEKPRTPAGTKAFHRLIRVAYIVNSLRDGGTERQVLELLRHHDRNLIEPSLILMDDQNAERARALVNSVFVMGIPSDGNANWLPRSFRYVNAIRRTDAYLRRSQPDIVHALLPGPGILGGLAAVFARVPVFIRSPRSMLGLYRSRTRVGAWLDNVFLRRADFCIGNSEAVSRELIKVAKCNPEKCGTIYNGVDLNRFHPELSRSWRSSVGWDECHLVFGLVGNFGPAKRHCDFVRAAVLISKNHPEARFVMLGADYGLRQSVLAQIDARELASKFYVADVTMEPERILAALDVYVCTSATEGFSNALLEAMACGKPVIATDVGGNSEAVVHAETGFLVPVGSPRSVADVAELLLRDSSLRHIMGMRGRKRVEEHFSLRAMTEATEQLYMRILRAA